MSLAQVGRYYSEKLAAHGASPRGVDWNGAESQRLRFDELLRVCEGAAQFSINDVGCGYGALFEYLIELGKKVDYLGVDIAPAMIAKAEELHRGRPGCRFLAGERADRVADYAVASGIFNVKLSASDAAWRSHVLSSLEALDAGSRRGFAFNCLTKYSDAVLMKDYLFYADPCQLFDYCKTRFSKNVALLHDYGLYEFTIVVRKS
jgi:SAM-dependent methyltransferase